MPAVKGKVHWTDNATAAHVQAQKGLAVVDSLLSWVKAGSGKPSMDERNLFMAAVAFAYGVWENFVEQLAIEVTAHLSKDTDPSRIPEDVHQEFTKGHSTWDISVTPGWRALWRERVSIAAVGDGRTFGLNTANRANVERLFTYVGVKPFEGVTEALVVPLDKLVELRGEVVHTSMVPESLKKAQVSTRRDQVAKLIDAVDAGVRRQARDLLGWDGK